MSLVTNYCIVLFPYNAISFKKDCQKTIKCDIWELDLNKGMFNINNAGQVK